MKNEIVGRVRSLQSFGTLDGPGVRFVVFAQGCPLRCACCHNPETWDPKGGKEYTARELADKIARYKSYFGSNGGITLSGGEPLMQPEFAAELFRLCHERGIHTCLDTSGSLWGEAAKRVLEVTDYCLLDIKYTSEKQYLEYVGCEMEKPMQFLEQLNRRGIPTRIRQVLIRGLNDSEESIRALARLVAPFSCVEETEFLPFRTLCLEKYEQMNLTFRLADTKDTTMREVTEAKEIFNREMNRLVGTASDSAAV